MMADYIKREDILARFEQPVDTYIPMLNVSIDSIVSLINSIPSADVVEREAYNQMVDLALSQGTIVNKIKELVGARNG